MVDEAPDNLKKVTPPILAEAWRATPEKIIALIRSGELPAIDVSLTPGVGRPRYLIGLDDIRAFEQRRRVVPPPASQATRKTRQSSDVIEFF